jgi:hypothetical protein
MNRYLWVLNLLLLLSGRCTGPGQPTDNQRVQPIRDLGEGRYELRAAGARLQVDAQTGGRITSLRLGETELLTDSSVHAQNYGSSFWTSPQSQWGWPPYPVLDVQPYRASLGDEALQLYSPDDPLSGFRAGKKFTLAEADSAFVITYTLTNVSDSTRRVAPWEVTRVPAGGLTFFAAGTGQPLPQSNLAGIHRDANDIVWFAYDTARIHSHQKLFMNGQGWLAHVHRQVLFIKRFADIPPGQTAPGQEEIEVYANKERTYVELENQGAYVSLAPQDSLTWTVKWYVRVLPEDIPAVPGDALVNRVRQVLGERMSE